MDWVAIIVGSSVVVLGLIGLIGNVRVRGLGAGMEPRWDGLGHLLLGASLAINAGLEVADSENSLLLATSVVSFIAGVVILVRGRVRAAKATRNNSP